jgi:hypothetical protein
MPPTGNARVAADSPFARYSHLPPPDATADADDRLVRVSSGMRWLVTASILLLIAFGAAVVVTVLAAMGKLS